MSLRSSSRFPRARTLVLRAGVCLTLAAASGVAVAGTAQSATTDLGTLVFTPATGLASSPINAHTVSKGPNTGCPSGAASVTAVVNGPAGWTNVPLIGSDSSNVSTTSDFDEPFGDTFTGVAQSNSLTITAGKYDISVICQDSLGTVIFGSFTAPIFFTDATHYQSNDPAVAVVSTSTAVTASPASPQVSGTAVTLTATVTPATAAGSVQFMDGASALGTALPVSGGKASLPTSALSAASHAISAVFTPSTGAFSASTAPAITYVVTSTTATTTVLTASPASPQVSGTSVMFTATVTPSTAAGSVQFKDGALALGSAQPLSSGKATFTTSALSAASHAISAVFTPSTGAFSASTASPINYVVSAPSAASTSTALAVSPASPQVAGTAVTFTATVTSAAAGTVQFVDGTTILQAAQAVSGGKATLATSTLTAGVHSITAVFAPTDTAAFTGSTSAALSFTISPPSVQVTSTGLTFIPPSPSPAGSPVAFTATVTPAGAVGSVQFKDGSSNLESSQPVSGGTAKLTTSALPSGTHQITAVFTPTDANTYAGSTSAAATYSISGSLTATTTALSTNPASPAASGTPVTVTASVAPVVAGTVQFQDGGTALGTPQTLVAGVASTSTSTLSAGSHALTAVFTPADASTYAGSTSAAITFVVNAPTGSNLGTLTFDPAAGQAVTTIQVRTQSTGATPGCPTGATNVRAVINGPGWSDIPAIGNDSATVSNTADFGVPLGDTFVGIAAANSLQIVAGKYDVTLYCQDDLGTVTSGSFTGSLYFTDATHYQSTNPASSTTTTNTSLAVGPDSRQDLGGAVTLMASVSPSDAVGTVQFNDAVTGVTSNVGHAITLSGGVGTFVTSSLPFGLHTFTVTFTPADATKFTASSSDSIIYVMALPIPPKLVTGAHLRGTARVGGVLACDATFRLATSYTYSWYRNGLPIPGAGRSTYRLERHDLLRKIACRATARNLGGSTPSMSRTVNVGLQFRLVGAPAAIHGAHRVGVTLVAWGGSWSPRPQAYRYVWLRDARAIAGATRQTYRVAKADMGHRISVTVTVTAIFFNPAASTSRPI